MLHTGEGPQQEAQLSLFFEAFETAALLVTVVLVTFVLCVANGCSNWLVGVVLTSAYLVVCQGFWSHKDEDLDAAHRVFLAMIDAMATFEDELSAWLPTLCWQP